MSPTVLIKSKFEQLLQNASKKETLYVTFCDSSWGHRNRLRYVTRKGHLVRTQKAKTGNISGIEIERSEKFCYNFLLTCHSRITTSDAIGFVSITATKLPKFCVWKLDRVSKAGQRDNSMIDNQFWEDCPPVSPLVPFLATKAFRFGDRSDTNFNLHSS